VRTRLTLTSDAKEREFEDAVLLSRSRYISQATRPLRFYREYVQADSEETVVKERLRWHVDYRDMRLYFNFDTLSDQPDTQQFLEIKSRTWSLKDAEHKAAAIAELLAYLGIEKSSLVRDEYYLLGG
jgi:5-methylthioadenosine/S-adenosylhomocysteine deaminase